MRTCSKCGLEKPGVDFVPGKGQCRKCINARKAAWARARPYDWAAYRAKNRERVHRNHRRYYDANTELCKARAKAHREKSRDEREQWLKERKAICAERRRLRNIRNVRKWRAANPEKVRENARNGCQRRRAKYRGVGLPRGVWGAIKADFGFRCAYCGAPANLEQDHLDPLCLGGYHDSTNIVPACAFCNRSKGGRTLLQWLAA